MHKSGSNGIGLFLNEAESENDWSFCKRDSVIGVLDALHIRLELIGSIRHLADDRSEKHFTLK